MGLALRKPLSRPESGWLRESVPTSDSAWSTGEPRSCEWAGSGEVTLDRTLEAWHAGSR